MSVIVRKVQESLNEYNVKKLEKEIGLKEEVKKRLEEEIQTVGLITTTEMPVSTLSGRLTTRQFTSLPEEAEMGHDVEGEWVYVPTRDIEEKVAKLSEEIDALRAKLVVLQSKKF